MSKTEEKFIDLISDNHEEDALKLLDKIKNFNCFNEKRQSALQLACNRDLKILVSKLINNGAEIDSRDQWKVTPLMRAAYNSCREIIKMLLDAGADINARHIYGKTPILFAADNGNKKTIQLLLDSGADIDDTDEASTSCLHYAAGRSDSNSGIIKLILASCSHKELKDENGKTALDYAVEMGSNEGKKVLKKAGLKQSSAEEISEAENEKYKLLVKKSTCPSCGAMKMKPSVGAWIYCDFCATCIDWDFNRAKQANPDKSIMAEYTNNYEKRMSKLKAVEEKGEMKTWEKLMRKECEIEIKAYPAMHPLRIKNEKYKENYLNFLVNFRLLLLDKDLQQLQAEQEEKNQRVLWNGYTADHLTFSILLNVFIKYQKKAMEKAAAKGVLELHPDNISKELLTKINFSTFIHAWIPYLESSDVEMTLSTCGLKSDYQEIKPFKYNLRKCGGCGAELQTLEESKRMICENCGVIVNLKIPELSCSGCSAPLSFPVDQNSLNCPNCGVIVSRVSRDIT